jgi:sterol desaturase/sphingolipid hydroxylase (fatty acid hydroxylase superfamily)
VNYIVLAIPVFFLLIGVELLAARIGRRDYYRLSDTVNDLSCGILDQLLEMFLKTAIFAGYVFVYERFRLATLPADSAVVWLVGFLGVDFLYYWLHRSSHEVNALWANHVVHHQSEDFNLAVALRQGSLQSTFTWFFYLPLAWAGLSPLTFLTLSSVNTLYQFWIHTRAIGRLGPLEWVLNTPSNHRVHHGREPKYIDKNHGGTLIVWDRLFGTYQAEEEEPVYGITRPLASWNPVWANLHYWIELLQTAARTRRWIDRLRLFLKPPGWRPLELGGFVAAAPVDATTYRKWDVERPPALGAYALAQFVAVLGGASLLLFQQQRLGRASLAIGSALIAASLVALGGLLERKPWAPWLEALRLSLAAGWVAMNAPPVLAALALAASAGSVAWLWRLRGAFASNGGQGLNGRTMTPFKT